MVRRPFDGVGWPPIVREKERELYRELRNYCKYSTFLYIYVLLEDRALCAYQTHFCISRPIVRPIVRNNP